MKRLVFDLPPTVQPAAIRHMAALTTNTRNTVTGLTGQQGTATEGPKGATGPTGPAGATGAEGKIEPKTPEAPVARAAGTLYTLLFSATVYLTIVPKVEKVGYEIKVNGKVVFTLPPTLLSVAPLPLTYTLTIADTATWEVVMTEGALTELTSTYQEL
jgi:hypothetical protein